MIRDSEDPDSFPNSESPAPLPIESDWAPIIEFTTADIFQHSPFSDMLNSLKSLSLSRGSGPNYVRLEWKQATKEFAAHPPPTSLL